VSLQNPVRARAKAIVSLSPGVHLRKLQKLLGASFSTTRYHVRNLELDGEIVCSREGRYRRLYPAGTDDGSKTVYAFLQSKNARKILGALAQNQRDLSNGGLFEMVDLPRSTISEHLASLNRAGLVRRHVTADGCVLYQIQNRERMLNLLAAFEKNLLNMATDSFIDLWDL
jgi:predicted transcriptional regulator